MPLVAYRQCQIEKQQAFDKELGMSMRFGECAQKSGVRGCAIPIYGRCSLMTLTVENARPAKRIGASRRVDGHSSGWHLNELGLLANAYGL